jgi:hypothetical protein
LAAAVAASVFATSSADAAWYTGTIYKIQIAPNGSFTVYLEAAADNECGSTHVRFANTNAASLKMVFAAVLVYEAQAIPVQFSIQSCRGNFGVFEYIEST